MQVQGWVLIAVSFSVSNATITLLRILVTIEKAYYLIKQQQHVLIPGENYNKNNEHFQRYNFSNTLSLSRCKKTLTEIQAQPFNKETITLLNFKNRFL